MPFWKEVDILDRELLMNAVRADQPQAILHCAARTDLDGNVSLESYSVNVDGVCHLLDAIRAAKSVSRVIFFSSQLVCRVGYHPADDNDYQPTTSYGRSKVLGEKIVRAASDIGPTLTIVRPTSLWGPWMGMPYRLFFDLIGKGHYVHPRGVRTLKQWGFVGNTVYQVDRLLSAPARKVHANTFYLADYEPVELRAFADLVQRTMGAPRIRSLALGIYRLAARIGDMLKWLGLQRPPLTSFRLGNILADEMADLEPLRRLVGPLPYNIDHGIQMTVTWLRSPDSYKEGSK
jgi:nucleoside-diphosphate-sugar epimerase